MDWRLQIASLAPAIITAMVAFSADVYFSCGNCPANVSSWNFVVSLMQYLLISGFILVVLSIAWPGAMGRISALTLIVLSLSVGFVMFLAWLDLGIYQLTYRVSCPDPTVSRCSVAAAQNPTIDLVTIGLLIPTSSIISTAAWLLWAARKHPEVFHG